MYTMVKLRLNALIGIFLLLADEGHTITCVLFLPLKEEAILKESENGKGWAKFFVGRHSKKLQVWWPLDGGAFLAYFAHICW